MQACCKLIQKSAFIRAHLKQTTIISLVNKRRYNTSSKIFPALTIPHQGLYCCAQRKTIEITGKDNGSYNIQVDYMRWYTYLYNAFNAFLLRPFPYSYTCPLYICIYMIQDYIILLLFIMPDFTQ